MIMEIEIRNVDERAYTDIRYIIDRYLMGVEGIKNTREGSGVPISSETGISRERYEINRNN